MTPPLRERCYWLDSASPPSPPGRSSAEPPLPGWTEVAVIGGGYTGVAAARALARLGVDVTVLERETLGWGASTRNGGFVLPGFKLSALALVRRFGAERARSLFEASTASVRFLEQLIAEAGIACDYARSGHVSLASRPAHVRRLGEAQQVLAGQFGYETISLPRERLREEIGSARYFGGLVDPNAGGLHPAKYFAGLAAAAERAGARLLEHVEALSLERTAGGFAVVTSRGRLRARDVLVATNGYSGAVHPELRRRVIPIGSYIIATAPLGEALASELIPRGRMLSDTKHLLFYFRLSPPPDTRLLFGGRASFTPTTTLASARILAEGMRSVFPQLASVPVEYSWSGNVGFTFDQLPHAGRLDGVYYALGYCGHGVAMATYLGNKVGEAIAGRGDILPLAELGFPTAPLYRGRPWFLPLAGAYFRLLDRFT